MRTGETAFKQLYFAKQDPSRTFDTRTCYSTKRYSSPWQPNLRLEVGKYFSAIKEMIWRAPLRYGCTREVGRATSQVHP